MRCVYQGPTCYFINDCNWRRTEGFCQSENQMESLTTGGVGGSAGSGLAKLVAADAKVKVVYRELPILSEESSDAAKVSLLAAERGQYMAYHKAMYGAGRVTRDSIIAAAGKAGISKADAEAAIASSKYDAEIQSNIALAQKLQASGTPTFVIGGQVLNGAVGYEALQSGVAAARGK